MTEQLSSGKDHLLPGIWGKILREPARPEWVRRWPGAPWLVVGTVCIGSFLGQLDASIVTLVMPSVRNDLGASLAQVEWVALIYLLVLVGSISAIGRLADMLGRKVLYMYAFALSPWPPSGADWPRTERGS